MSEQEKKSGSHEEPPVVMVEQSTESRHKQPYRPIDVQDEASADPHHKRSRAPAVPSVTEALKEGESPDFKERMESECAMTSEIQKHNVAKKKSSTTTKVHDSSPSLAPLEVEKKISGRTSTPKQSATEMSMLTANITPALSTTTAPALSTTVAPPQPTTIVPTHSTKIASTPSIKVATTPSVKIVQPPSTKVAPAPPTKVGPALSTTVAPAVPTKVAPALSVPVAPTHTTKVPPSMSATVPMSVTVPPSQKMVTMQKMAPPQKMPVVQNMAATQKIAPQQKKSSLATVTLVPNPASPTKQPHQSQSSQPIQPLAVPPGTDAAILIEKTADDKKKGDEDSITEEIAELRTPEPSKKTTEWSDDEEASGLPRSDSRGSRMTRAVRQLFCCGQPYEAPSEDNISYARENCGSGI